MLDVQSTDKGMLVPRVALQSVDIATPISPAPPASLLVYNTATSGVAPNNVTPGYYYWSGSSWTRLMSGNTAPITGSGAADKVAFWTSGTDLSQDNLLHWDNTGKRLGVGLDNPSVRLQVAGGIIASDDISATGGNLHTNRRRVVFSSIATDVNHSIYNNFTNIDGEGSWDGMKMNVFAGLDVRTGNAGAGQQVSNLRIADGLVRVGRTTGPSTLEIGDVNTGEWRLSTGGSALSIGNDFDDNGTYDTRVYIRNNGNVGIGNTVPNHQLSVGVPTADIQGVTVRGYSDIGSWKGGGAFGFNSASVIMGQLNGMAEIGGHSATLNAWADLAINSGGGNVGVGTSSPSTKFHTTGGVRLETLSGSGSRFVVADANGNLTATQSTASGVVTGNGTLNYLARWTPDGNTLGIGVTWDDGTNVGIGTTSPLQKIDIGGNGGIGFSGASPFVNSDDKKLYSPDDGILEWMTHDNAGAHGFAVSHQGTKRVYLNTLSHSYLTSGNLAIGHTAPSHRLSVGDATADGQAVTIRGYSDIGGWKGGAAFGYNSASVIMGELSGVATIGAHNATLGAWADLAINSGGGNVGVGTSSPQILIDTRVNSIIGTSATAGSQHDVANRGTKVSFGTTSGGEFAGMRLVVDPGTNACGNTGDIRFDTWECNTATTREVMRISGRGRVGIGTPSPSHRLQIEGTNDALRLVGTGTLGAQAKINFGDANHVYLEETADDFLTVHASGGTRIGNQGTYTKGVYHGKFNVGDNNGNACGICVFTGWSGSVLEIQVPWSSLGIPNGTNKTVMLMADGNNNSFNDNWSVTLQQMTSDRMDIFIDRVDGSVWGLTTMRLHYIVYSND